MDNNSQVMRRVNLLLIIFTGVFIIAMVSSTVIHTVYTNFYSQSNAKNTEQKIVDTFKGNNDLLHQSIIEGALVKMKDAVNGLQNYLSVAEQIVDSSYNTGSTENYNYEVERGHYYISPGVSPLDIEDDVKRLGFFSSFINRGFSSYKTSIAETAFQTASGMFLSSDGNANKIVSETKMDLRKRDWYIGASKTTGFYISMPYQSVTGDKGINVACSKAVRVNNKIVGVLIADLSLKTLGKGVFKGTKNAIMVDRKGNILANITADKTTYRMAEDNLVKIQKLISEIDDDEYQIDTLKSRKIAYLRLTGAPWGIVSIFDFSVTEKSINSVVQSFKDSNDRFASSMLAISVILLLVSLLVMITGISLTMRFVRRSMSSTPKDKSPSRSSIFGKKNKTRVEEKK